MKHDRFPYGRAFLFYYGLAYVKSIEAAGLITEEDKGQEVWLDAGYTGLEGALTAKGVKPIICEKGFRNHPLTDSQKLSNKQKSTVRSRVEHVFGFMEQSMRGLIFRCIGTSGQRQISPLQTWFITYADTRRF